MMVIVLNLNGTCPFFPFRFDHSLLMIFFLRYVPILPMVLVNGSDGIGTGRFSLERTTLLILLNPYLAPHRMEFHNSKL